MEQSMEQTGTNRTKSLPGREKRVCFFEHPLPAPLRILELVAPHPAWNTRYDLIDVRRVFLVRFAFLRLIQRTVPQFNHADSAVRLLF